MTNIDIVRITPDDWALFRDIRLRALADAPGAFGSRFDDWVDAPESSWRSRLENVKLNLVARHGDEAVGMASGSLDGDDAALISMWVDPVARGTGTAQALIEAVVGWARGLERTTYLMVRSDNPRAIAAYERAGFVYLGVPDDHDGPPENRMVHRSDAK
ncbi:MAG: GNAT family N-acetyltransferase [Nocardioides sp.]|nr:GNAT family N-acetyltransferase [Nocardioides sp.]